MKLERYNRLSPIEILFMYQNTDFTLILSPFSLFQRMENLADEKNALEQKLASEKLALNNEKQGLEGQLRDALNKLRECEEMLQKEKSMTAQLESMLNSSSDENEALKRTLQTQMEETSGLNTQLLMLQANSERDTKLLEGLRKRVEEDDLRITQLIDEAEEGKNQRAHWESEKEDLHNQIDVLTEERDAARQSEEELFEVLRERTGDLERLQESYVDMTDRCNDYQDNMNDLREEMEALKDRLLAEQRASFVNLSVAVGSGSPPPPPLLLLRIASKISLQVARTKAGIWTMTGQPKPLQNQELNHVISLPERKSKVMPLQQGSGVPAKKVPQRRRKKNCPPDQSLHEDRNLPRSV
jgi:hypothetical protein